MRLFNCESCGSVLFFENSCCMTCGQRVGYCAESTRLVALPRDAAHPTVQIELPDGRQEPFIDCKTRVDHDACNWLVRASEGEAYCLSCRLTEVIPDLSEPKNRQAWADVESAKRRLLYTLRALRLPVRTRADDRRRGLSFKFLQGTEEQPVTTGHADGVITLNIAEADHSYRENMREKLGEGYRTVLGHLRHEIGHYYWDQLVSQGGRAEACRAVFGDERASYEAAIERHYGEGPPADWASSFISAYATMHPWEDWAETWAHYLHLLDTLETAKSHGLAVRVPGEPGVAARVSTDNLTFDDFDAVMAGWQAVTVALNSLSRSMGLKDVYPFVLSVPVRDKLRFIHDLIQECGANPQLVLDEVEEATRALVPSPDDSPADGTASDPPDEAAAPAAS